MEGNEHHADESGREGSQPSPPRERPAADPGPRPTEPYGEEACPSPAARECRLQDSLESGPPPKGVGEPTKAQEQARDAVPASTDTAEEELDMGSALAQFEGRSAVTEPRPPRPAHQRRSQERGSRHGAPRRLIGPGQERTHPEEGSQEAADRALRRGSVPEPSGEEVPPPKSVGKRPASGRGAAQGKQGIKTEILAHTSFEETRIAVLEDGRLVELHWERKNAQSIVGNIYKGVVENVLPGISSAFINIGFDKNAYLYISDVLGDARAPIDHTLKKGQEVMIQVAKEAIGTKGMKVTMEVSLPGRYLVLTPFQKEVGISKHIVEPEERSRLGGILNKLAAELLGGMGVVVRTEAEGATETELSREVRYLLRAWEAIERRYEGAQPPCLLHKDLDVTMQIARDMLSQEVYVYLLDNKEAYQGVLDFIGKISPELKDRVRPYEGKTPIFSAFNIESEIEKLRQTKVSLPSGGTIVVQEAESLCAIDVNTGRFTGSKSQEDTVTVTNIEAAVEIAHQLRLRNIGGIVVIDFIDMRKASNRNRVMDALADAVRRDRAKIRILPITRLGLIEMTRERRRESTVSLMTDECPECHGAGRVLSAESLRIRVQREIHELTQGRPGGQIRLQLHPQLANAFKERQSVIEKNVHRSIRIQADPMLPWEDYRIILE